MYSAVVAWAGTRVRWKCVILCKIYNSVILLGKNRKLLLMELVEIYVMYGAYATTICLCIWPGVGLGFQLGAAVQPASADKRNGVDGSEETKHNCVEIVE